MDAFEYLSVLISIVLGLALTQLLSSAARLVQARSRVRPYWPTLMWVGTLLLIIVQSWWALFDFRDHASWTLPEFALLLAHPTVLYFMCVLVLPDSEVEGEISLKRNYYAQAPWFFAGGAAMILFSLGRPIMFDGELPLDPDRVFQLAFLLTAIVCARSKRETPHKVAAVTLPLSLAAYAGLLFFELG